VHLGCFVDEPDDMAHADFLRSMTASATFIPLRPQAAQLRSIAALASARPLSFAYFDDPRMRRFVDQKRRRNLAAEFAFSSSMAPYIAKKAGVCPRFVDLCDADSEKWREYAAATRGPMKAVYTLEAERLAAAETRIVNWADACFAVSRAEAEIFESRGGLEKPVVCFGNGVDADYFSPAAIFEAPHPAFDVVFVGAMDYRANVDAVIWFAQKVWPMVRKSAPGATFAIVGARPAKSVRALGGKNAVTVTGRVDDVRPFLKNARTVIAPLRVARGVQNKALEAMAMARPLVATASVAAAIEARAGEELLVADRPEDFASAVLSLLSAPEHGAAIGAAARARVVKDFGWAAKLDALDAALKKAGMG
jgi:sugar transferase (PEP-CTERM/EpsH1 system associated)